jgi:hypothetical protein
VVIKVSSPLVYGKRGSEAQLRPKYQGKRGYFILQLIGFLFKMSREYDIFFLMVMKLECLSETLGKV